MSCEQAHRTIALCRSLGSGTFAPMGLAGAMYRSLDGRKRGGPHGIGIYAEAKLNELWPQIAVGEPEVVWKEDQELRGKTWVLLHLTDTHQVLITSVPSGPWIGVCYPWEALSLSSHVM